MSERLAKPGDRLRALREQHGLSLRAVHISSLKIAKELGQGAFAIPPSRLHEIEKKSVVPSIHRLYTLARLYECCMDDILQMYGIPSCQP